MILVFIVLVAALITGAVASLIVPGRTPGGKPGAFGFGLGGSIIGLIVYLILLSVSGGAVPRSGPGAWLIILVVSIAVTTGILFALRSRSHPAAQV